jgi:hypothetical protein
MWTIARMTTARALHKMLKETGDVNSSASVTANRWGFSILILQGACSPKHNPVLSYVFRVRIHVQAEAKWFHPKRFRANAANIEVALPSSRPEAIFALLASRWHVA